MRDEERQRIRERARRRTRRQRRALIGVLVALVAGGATAVVGAVVSSGGSDASTTAVAGPSATGRAVGETGSAATASTIAGEVAATAPAPPATPTETPPVAPRPPPPPPELPRGGRRILPDNRVVAYFGAPQDEALGVLGIGSLDQAGAKLERQLRAFARPRRPAIPALELIVTIASGSAGADGGYSYRQKDPVIRDHLRAARRHKALLLLDIQPGREPFMEEVRAMRKWLVLPDVGLALDPEWSMGPGQVPGQQIGSTTAAIVNRVSGYLQRLIDRYDLPQKLLIVHQFTEEMIVNRPALRRRPGVALVLDADGVGDPADKVAKYELFATPPPKAFHGFKVFFEEDTRLMSPSEVLALRPRPDVVIYE